MPFSGAPGAVAQTAPAAPAPAAPAPAGSLEESAESTRRRVLQLVASDGPVTAAELAARLGLTSAGIRRHLAQLEDDGTIAVHRSAVGPVRRGRPARAYVVTAGGQAELHDAYSEVAIQALRHLRVAGGKAAVEAFAAERSDDVVRRVRPRLTAQDPAERATQLAAALSEEGYAASLRPVAAATRVPLAQLCQGHCPVQQVASEFPEICEAEGRAFSELLGTHVQRLATIAGGAHACVTNLPLGLAAPAHPTATTNTATKNTAEGTR